MSCYICNNQVEKTHGCFVAHLEDLNTSYEYDSTTQTLTKIFHDVVVCPKKEQSTNTLFHEKCIKDWISSSHNCPVCNKKSFKVEVFKVEVIEKLYQNNKLKYPKKINKLSLQEIKDAAEFFKNQNKNNTFLNDLEKIYEAEGKEHILKKTVYNSPAKRHQCITYLDSSIKKISSYKPLFNPYEKILMKLPSNEVGSKEFLDCVFFSLSSFFNGIFIPKHLYKIIENSITIKKIPNYTLYLEKREKYLEIQKLLNKSNVSLEKELEIIKNLKTSYDYLNKVISRRIKSESILLALSIINVIAIIFFVGLITGETLLKKKFGILNLDIIKDITEYRKLLKRKLLIQTIFMLPSIISVFVIFISIMIRIPILLSKKIYDDFDNLIKLHLKHDGWKYIYHDNDYLLNLLSSLDETDQSLQTEETLESEESSEEGLSQEINDSIQIQEETIRKIKQEAQKLFNHINTTFLEALENIENLEETINKLCSTCSMQDLSVLLFDDSLKNLRNKLLAEELPSMEIQLNSLEQKIATIIITKKNNPEEIDT
ncbi:MAG: hypothetical protein AMS24_01320 [Chlamydiae bacterium SM23_39]|nr:MAG: hypothetical protein AMS24_01320 [Chlamydiae bacterium SM23_39]